MPQILAYVILLIYAVFQELFLRDKAARSFRRASKLDLTTVWYVTAIAISLIAAPLLNSFRIFTVPAIVAYLGLVILILGIVFRATAMIELGKSYTRALIVVKNQRLVTTGLYKYIRHPGYSGTMLAGIGFAMAQGNLLIVLFVIILMSSVYVLRIRQEEEMLRSVFGKKYDTYAKRTKRLIPFVI